MFIASINSLFGRHRVDAVVRCTHFNIWTVELIAHCSCLNIIKITVISLVTTWLRVNWILLSKKCRSLLALPSLLCISKLQCLLPCDILLSYQQYMPWALITSVWISVKPSNFSITQAHGFTDITAWGYYKNSVPDDETSFFHVLHSCFQKV